MPNYRRYRQLGGTFFFTVNLRDRRNRLLVQHIDLLRGAVERVKSDHPFQIDAAVILPDHLHMIWTLPRDDDDYSTRWRLIKSRFSSGLRGVIDTAPTSTSRNNKKECGIWQRRFFEHTIRDDLDYARHVDYIHFNPVKHGHADRPVDWPYSSIHRYITEGILTSDWGTSGVQPEDLGYND